MYIVRLTVVYLIHAQNGEVKFCRHLQIIPLKNCCNKANVCNVTAPANSLLGRADSFGHKYSDYRFSCTVLYVRMMWTLV